MVHKISMKYVDSHPSWLTLVALHWLIAIAGRIRH